MLKYRLRSENLDAGRGLLFKVLLLDTVKARHQRDSHTWVLVELRGNFVTHGCLKPSMPLMGATGHYSVALLQLLKTISLQQCQQLLFSLVLSDHSWVWLSFTSKSSCRSPAQKPGIAQYLSVCWCSGCLSSNRHPDLAGTWVPGLFCCYLFGHWYLKPPHKDVPEPGLGEVQHLCSIQRTLVLLYMNVEREGRDSRFGLKSGNLSLELPLRCHN